MDSFGELDENSLTPFAVVKTVSMYLIMPKFQERKRDNDEEFDEIEAIIKSSFRPTPLASFKNKRKKERK